MPFSIVVSSPITHLTNLKNILAKAKSWQESNGYKEEAVLAAHLAVDQFPLVKQVQLASDYAKRLGATLCGVEAPKYEDNEKTFAELEARIDKTIEFLSTLKEDMVKNDLETRLVPLPWMPGKGLTAKYYVEIYGVSNFYFHYTTAYAILRNFGLPIGKGDYMGNLSFKDLA